MKIRNTLTAGLTAAVFAATLAAQTPAPAPAQPGEGHGRHHGMMRGKMMKRGFGRIAQALNLTDTQKQYARDLFRQNREATKATRDQLRATRQSLAQAIKANNEVEINRLTGEQAQLQGQLAAGRAKAMAKFYAQLTPEQKAQADQFMNQMRERHKNMRRGPQAGPARG